MPLAFPESPTVGTVFERWTWDGEKWALSLNPHTITANDLNARLTTLESEVVRENDDVKRLKTSTLPDPQPGDHLVLAVNADTGELVGLPASDVLLLE